MNCKSKHELLKINFSRTKEKYLCDVCITDIQIAQMEQSLQRVIKIGEFIEEFKVMAEKKGSHEIDRSKVSLESIKEQKEND